MNKITKLAFLLTSSISILSCSSSGDCTKTITIPEQVIQSPTGTAYIPAYEVVVPCDYVVTPIKEGVKLENLTYEVLQFFFTPDTGKNTSRLQYKIKLINPNNFTIKGVPKITTDTDGVVVSTFGVASEPFCTQIQANSSCTIILDKEYPLNPTLGLTKSIKLVTVEYILNF
jgi:hypothetical protein